jgi:hypothetical protein
VSFIGTPKTRQADGDLAFTVGTQGDYWAGSRPHAPKLVRSQKKNEDARMKKVLYVAKTDTQSMLSHVIVYLDC